MSNGRFSLFVPCRFWRYRRDAYGTRTFLTVPARRREVARARERDGRREDRETALAPQAGRRLWRRSTYAAISATTAVSTSTMSRQGRGRCATTSTSTAEPGGTR